MHRKLAALMGLALAMALAIPGAGVARAGTPNESPRLIATFPLGDQGGGAESLASWGGNLYASVTSFSNEEFTANHGQIMRVGPKGKLTAFGPSLDVCLLTGVAFDQLGRLYVATPSCGAPFTLPSGVLRITGGTATRVLTLPDWSFPNGLAFHDGDLYVSDSTVGAIWRVPAGSTGITPAEPWLQDALLAPPEQDFGVNGIAFWGDILYAVNTGTGSVITVPVQSDGSPGTPTLLATDPSLVGADGVAFDALGRLWITIAYQDSLVRVDQAGAITTVLSDPAWLDYPTQPVFGTTAPTRTTVYVMNAGTVNPFIDALDVDVAGQPLP